MFYILLVFNFIFYGTSIYFFIQEDYLAGGVLLGLGILLSIFTALRYRKKTGNAIDCALGPLDCVDCDGNCDCT